MQKEFHPGRGLIRGRHDFAWTYSSFIFITNI
jgi:hypothetical protein